MCLQCGHISAIETCQASLWWALPQQDLYKVLRAAMHSNKYAVFSWQARVSQREAKRWQRLQAWWGDEGGQFHQVAQQLSGHCERTYV